ncbi:MAG: hypothetical protein CUN56_00420 [Phototrophicales bacterium]|nr:MAG: hypothetical protein CUN56_00420 [Phototrophicales bacterium]
MTISAVNHIRLLHMLHETADPEWLLHYMPNWMTLERLESLLANYANGSLTPLQVTELDAVLEIVPALEAMWHEQVGQQQQKAS